MNADDSGQTRLTNNPADDYAPSWSPDGARSAFTSARDGAMVQIYVMNADGSGQTRLTDSPGFDALPSWRP
jgi:Tol biopolymer transport system component